MLYSSDLAAAALHRCPRRIFRLGILVSVVPLLSTLAGAATLSVDVDETMPGVQSDRTVAPGEQWSVAVRLDGVLSVDALSAFELDLDYDPLIVQVVSLESGDFLSAPTQTVESDVTEPDVNLAEFSTGGGSADGSGTLARVTLEAIAPGETILRLGDVRLARSAGGALFPDDAANASISVVPEPAVGTTMAVAALALLSIGRWTHRRTALGTSLALAMAAGFAQADAEPGVDTNSDGFVDILDIAYVSSCLGVDPAIDDQCTRADVDEDGDVDQTDLDLVIACFDTVVGPVFAYPGPLFDCVRDGFACDLADVSDEDAARMDQLATQSVAMLESGATIETTADFLAGEPDVVGVFPDGFTLAFRTAGAPPVYVHDAAGARTTGVVPGSLFVPTNPEIPPLEGRFEQPIGHRVVGRDRDMDGRRDRAKRALILSPYASEVNEVGPPAVAVLNALFEFDEYEVQQNYYENETVTIDQFLEWDDFDFIYVLTHGDAVSGELNGTRMGSQFILVGESTSSCAELRQSAAPTVPGVGAVRGVRCAWVNTAADGAPPTYRTVAAVEPVFFEQRYPQGLENAVVWFDACRSYRTRGFKLALTGRHSMFLGWDDYVSFYAAETATTRIIELAATRGLRLTRAWTLACEEGLCLDPRFEEHEKCVGENPLQDTGCAWADRDKDGDIDFADVQVFRGKNFKAAELTFGFDDTDQRVREVLTLLDPDTLQPATDGEVLVSRFSGALEDGLALDGPQFRFEIQGFEPEDLVLAPDPDEFLRRTTFLSMDRDGDDVASDLPLTDQFMVPVGTPEEYRWRNTEPLFPLTFDEDLNEGDVLVVTPKLRFPPSNGNPLVYPVEIDNSYAEDLVHTIAACSFDAAVSGASSGAYSGILATVDLGSDWSLAARTPFNPNNPQQLPFIFSVSAARNLDLPGAVTSAGITIPTFPPRSYSWSSGSADPAPQLTIDSNLDGRQTGSFAGTLRDGNDTVNVSLSFDADILTPENAAGPCVR